MFIPTPSPRNRLIILLGLAALPLSGCSVERSKEEVRREALAEYKGLVDATGVANPALVDNTRHIRPVVTVTLINTSDKDLTSLRVWADLSYEGTTYHDAQVIRPLDVSPDSHSNDDRNILPKDGGKISFPVQFREYKGAGDGATGEIHHAVINVKVTDVGLQG